MITAIEFGKQAALNWHQSGGVSIPHEMAAEILPSRLGRYVAPTLIGAGATGLAAYLLTKKEEHKARNAGIAAAIGGLGGAGYGFFRQYNQLGSPLFSYDDSHADNTKNKLHMHQLLGWGEPGTVRTHTVAGNHATLLDSKDLNNPSVYAEPGRYVMPVQSNSASPVQSSILKVKLK